MYCFFHITTYACTIAYYMKIDLIKQNILDILTFKLIEHKWHLKCDYIYQSFQFSGSSVRIFQEIRELIS